MWSSRVGRVGRDLAFLALDEGLDNVASFQTVIYVDKDD